jgi:large subunit ribosomal protein L16
VSFGSFGLKAQTQSRVKSNQIEAARRVISRTLGKTGKIWIRIFPTSQLRRSLQKYRMGKGKGDPDHFIFDVRPGRVLFEIDGVQRQSHVRHSERQQQSFHLRQRSLLEKKHACNTYAYERITKEE